MDEIGLYTLEPKESQSKCLPYFLRDTLSSSQHSSRPSDIVLKGPKYLIKNDSL